MVLNCVVKVGLLPWFCPSPWEVGEDREREKEGRREFRAKGFSLIRDVVRAV